jgi:hypothetical protein
MNCDDDIREEVMESMKLPWQKRPFYATEAKTTTPHRPGVDRRSGGILKRVRRFYWHVTDVLGFFGICMIIIGVGVTATLIYGMWPR